MSLTLATFRDSIRLILKDRTIWRDTMINGWIKDAIRDYSNTFPMEATYKIDCVAAQREYSLSSPVEVLGILSVEYPDGENPPRFLQQKSELSPLFKDQPFYDLRQPIYDADAGGVAAIYPVLVIGESPASTEDIILRYQTVHRIPSADSDYLTVPEEHLEAIRLFVYWKAIVHLSLDQEVDAGRKTAMISALGGTAKQAEYTYHYKLKSYQGPAPLTGLTSPWKMDKNDRIY